jgi:hypothetical protein
MKRQVSLAAGIFMLYRKPNEMYTRRPAEATDGNVCVDIRVVQQVDRDGQKKFSSSYRREWPSGQNLCF